jgi:hypothetical protein
MASAFLLLSVPLAVLQVILVSRAPLWNLPRDRIGMVTLLALFIFLPLVHWLNSGRTWAIWLTALTAVSWFVVTFFSALQQVSFWMGIFVTLLGAYWVVTWSWLKFELQKSYFDPRMKWYHGSPEAISGLHAKVSEGSVSGDYRVCRFDRDGAFIFRSAKAGGEAVKKPEKRLKAAFSFRGSEVEVEGSIIKVIGKNEGFGVRFEMVSSDASKDIGDFIERLKGEGYA